MRTNLCQRRSIRRHLAGRSALSDTLPPRWNIDRTITLPLLPRTPTSTKHDTSASSQIFQTHQRPYAFHYLSAHIQLHLLMRSDHRIFFSFIEPTEQQESEPSNVRLIFQTPLLVLCSLHLFISARFSSDALATFTQMLCSFCRSFSSYRRT